MSHETISPQLSAYLDEELTDAERAAVDAHLGGCSTCRETLEGLRATLAAVATLPEPAPREQDSWALRAAIARERSPRRGRVWQAAAALGSVAAVLAGFIVFNGGNTIQPPAASDMSVAMAPAAPMVLDANYNAETAPSLLNAMLTFAEAAPAQPAMGGSTQERSTANADGPITLDDGSAAWLEDIGRCEAVVLEDAREPYTAERYVVARFRKEQALFLIYSVGDPVTRRELWVMEPGSCSTLHFAQTAT